MWYLKVGVFAVLLLRNTHGLRRYALRAYAAFAPSSLTINSQTAKLNVNLLPVVPNEKHKFFRIQVQMINHHNYWR